MKRIMVVTHAGGSPYHGPNMRWYYLAKALESWDIQVEIVSSSYFHKYLNPPRVSESVQLELVDQVPYHWIWTKPYNTRGLSQVRNQWEFIRGCYRASKRLANRSPDLVLASSPHPFVAFPGASIARKANARFVFEVRDLWPEVLVELGNFSRLHPYMIALKIAEWYGVRRSERVISVKPGDIEYFVSRYKLDKSAFSYVPNGFLWERSFEEPPAIIRKLRRKYRFILGYVGALSAYYRLEDLIGLAERFRGCRDIGFVVVGQGERLESLRDKARAMMLEDFHLIGPINKSAVPATLAEFDACYVGLEDVEIHRFGVSCNKIYEYMAVGKPIVASYNAGYDPVASAGCGVVARPGEYDVLEEGLREIVDNFALREEMGRRARIYFSTHHDYRVIAGRLVECLFPEESKRRPLELL